MVEGSLLLYQNPEIVLSMPVFMRWRWASRILFCFTCGSDHSTGNRGFQWITLSPGSELYKCVMARLHSATAMADLWPQHSHRSSLLSQILLMSIMPFELQTRTSLLVADELPHVDWSVLYANHQHLLSMCMSIMTLEHSWWSLLAACSRTCILIGCWFCTSSITHVACCQVVTLLPSCNTVTKL